MVVKQKLLFGSVARGWNVDDWTAIDDRVRGGKSESHLTCSESTARFYGHLDIKTLGGAGFASQRTTGDDRMWDLAEYDGIELLITEADAKWYTFILKDELLPPNPTTGRDQSTISYEYDFQVAMEETKGNTTSVCIAWDDLKATYRGKKKDDAPPLNVGSIKRMSFMMRSFFGTQQGDFSVIVDSISAITRDSSTFDGDSDLGKSAQTVQEEQSQSFISWLVRKCWKL